MKNFIKSVGDTMLMFTLIPEACFLCCLKKFDDEHISDYFKWVVNTVCGED